jgi:creatinine amidohydrolase
VRPENVDMAQAQHFHSRSEERAAVYPVLGDGRSAKLGWQMQDYHPLGAAGNAAAATPEKGRALIDAAGLQLARLLAEISSLPLDTLRAEPQLR